MEESAYGAEKEHALPADVASIDPSQTALSFYPATAMAWEAMYRDCEKAQKSIDVEQYILQDDATGKAFLELFLKKAREGVAIRLIFDTVGSRKIMSSPLVKEIQGAGGRVHFFNRLGWRNLFMPSTWFPRTHTKTLLVDEAVAYTGSVCIDSSMQNRRDMHIRFTGPLVKDVRDVFARHWKKPFKKSAKNGMPSSATPFTVPPEKKFRYITSAPWLRPNPIYKELLQEIEDAKENICLVTPYFLPPRRLQKALFRAVRRGVDVRIMMGEKSDTRLADHVSHTYFPRLLKHGIRIFLYPQTVLHAKYAIIDMNWATIGSTNLDYLSLHKNREANVIFKDKEAISRLKSYFEQDILSCIPVDQAFYDHIPFVYKFIGYAGRLIKKVL